MRVLQHKDDTVAAQEHLGRVAVLEGKKCVLPGRVCREKGTRSEVTAKSMAHAKTRCWRAAMMLDNNSPGYRIARARRGLQK
jgi:hypothetical protein